MQTRITCCSQESRTCEHSHSFALTVSITEAQFFCTRTVNVCFLGQQIVSDCPRGILTNIPTTDFGKRIRLAIPESILPKFTVLFEERSWWATLHWNEVLNLYVVWPAAYLSKIRLIKELRRPTGPSRTTHCGRKTQRKWNDLRTRLSCLHQSISLDHTHDLFIFRPQDHAAPLAV